MNCVVLCFVSDLINLIVLVTTVISKNVSGTMSALYPLCSSSLVYIICGRFVESFELSEYAGKYRFKFFFRPLTELDLQMLSVTECLCFMYIFCSFSISLVSIE